MHVPTEAPASPALLASLLGGAFVRGRGTGEALTDPVDGTTVAVADASGLDLGAALRFARTTGRPALAALTYGERAAMLGRIADVLAARRDEWYAIALRNSGNTRADAAIDVDGAIGTLKYFAKTGGALGAATLLADGVPIRLARDPAFVGLHVGTPIGGVAIHINAFNFPAWGLWEKAAVALLAGVPVFAKPATATAWLAAAMVAAVHDADVLPAGALSLLCGRAGDLLDHVEPGDAIAFTGSAETGDRVRRHPRVVATGARVNVEADSLNAALLAPGVAAGTPLFAAFVREVVREMTVKAGQKCTAIRRVLVPVDVADAVATAIGAALDDVVVGDPRDEGVGMGPLVSAEQRSALDAGVRALGAGSRVVYRKADVPAGTAFAAPLLLRAEGDARAVHEIEAFGPVATLVPYRDAVEAFALARRGGGSLAISVFAEDLAFLSAAATELAPAHGRVLLVDPSIADSHTGHGIVLPSLIHGGPGRAGGGEELGGLRGLAFYHQWSAVQGSSAVVDDLVQRSANLRLL